MFIDIKMLNQSRAELEFDDPADFSHLLNVFLSSTNAADADIRIAFEVKDYERIKRLAHKTKSSAKMLGCLKLYEICQNLEDCELANESQFIKCLDTYFEISSGTFDEMRSILQSKEF